MKYVRITYRATINTDAVSVNQAANEATLTYGNGTDTTTREDDITLYNYQLNIFKYTNGTNSEGKEVQIPLSGAKFSLYKQGETTPLQLLQIADGYRLLGKDEVTTGKTVVTEIETGTDGKVNIQGLDKNTTYVLKETKAPEGYNLVNGEITVSSSEITVETLEMTQPVLNNKGSQLPSTGGMGTTMLYVAGGILVLGAGILLITRRRMNSEN